MLHRRRGIPSAFECAEPWFTLELSPFCARTIVFSFPRTSAKSVDKNFLKSKVLNFNSVLQSEMESRVFPFFAFGVPYPALRSRILRSFANGRMELFLLRTSALS